MENGNIQHAKMINHVYCPSLKSNSLIFFDNIITTGIISKNKNRVTLKHARHHGAHASCPSCQFSAVYRTRPVLTGAEVVPATIVIKLCTWPSIATPDGPV